MRTHLLLIWFVSALLAACPRHDPEAARVAASSATARSTTRSVSSAAASTRSASTAFGTARDAEPLRALGDVASPRASDQAGPPGACAAPRPAPAPSRSLPRTIPFAWRPPGANPRLYAANAPEDQHRLVLTHGVTRGGRYPVVMAFHGQPRRGQAPRDYAFVRTVIEAVQPLVERREVEPLVLVLPVFRFEGQNWPDFDIALFAQEVSRLLAAEEIAVSGYLLFGHSGAAGCGGRGLNEASRLHPVAVGFFDTCVGPGFGQAVRALQRDHVPTLIMHSVETAGFRPRQPMEYQPNFDFGKVYRPLELEPMSECPKELPEAPLRRLAHRCAADREGTTRALVVDTGQGQEGHDAVIPVAVRYFLRQYAAAK